ncbi:outer membrane protein assembly factor BamE [uncultured Maricaulis sp.]|uniref:outer membrane protein assembly factor BamE n=1 Tax=uncultured Maricaulis sp. TaxID=174710 RepID=UPI0030DD6818|tara:strand:- start:6806 stop:7303 length:498 start_codon:yes stop_codon:yes gene_type:complete
MSRRVRLSVLIAACALGVSACNPILRSHGYRYTLGQEPSIMPDEDSRDSVMQRLGNPSMRGTFDENTWFYVSATRESLAYLRPVTRDRRIVAIRFNDETGMVTDVVEYTLEDGRMVDYVSRETPTRGRELSLLEQLLGNIGRLPGQQFGGEENLPGGAGGPRRNQ